MKSLFVAMTPARADDVCGPVTRDLLESRFVVRWGTEAFDVDELQAQLPGTDVLLTSWGTPTLTRELLGGTDRPQVVAHAAGSVKQLVDRSLLDEGLVVFSAAHRIAWSVGEYCLAATLTLLRRLPQFDRRMRDGEWKPADLRGAELTGRTVGIVGASSTARAFIALLAPFGVDIVVHDPYLDERQAMEMGIRLGPLEQVVDASIVSLHVPNVPATSGMINSDLIKQMRDGTIVINSSRGANIDSVALHEHVTSGRLLAALDVYDAEPPTLAPELLRSPYVLLSPHVAGDTIEGHQALADEVMTDAWQWLETGRRGRSFVDPARWPYAA